MGTRAEILQNFSTLSPRSRSGALQMLSFSVFDPGSGPGVLTPQPSCNCTTLALCGTRSGSGRGGIFPFGSVSGFANISVDPGRFAGCIDARRVLEKSMENFCNNISRRTDRKARFTSTKHTYRRRLESQLFSKRAYKKRIGLVNTFNYPEQIPAEKSAKGGRCAKERCTSLPVLE